MNVRTREFMERSSRWASALSSRNIVDGIRTETTDSAMLFRLVSVIDSSSIAEMQTARTWQQAANVRAAGAAEQN